MGSGTIELLPGASIVPLVIIAGASHLMTPQVPGRAALALEDLTWIAETATADDDLYRFERDLSSPEFPSSFGWEAINDWEPWRTNDKTFFKGGISQHTCTSKPTQEKPSGSAQSLSRAEKSHFMEQGYHRCGTRRWPKSHPATSRPYRFLAPSANTTIDGGNHLAPNRIGWSLPLITPPAAIVSSDPDWTDC